MVEKFRLELSANLGVIFKIVTAKILYTKENKKESTKIYFRTAIKFTYIQPSLIKLERLS